MAATLYAEVGRPAAAQTTLLTVDAERFVAIHAQHVRPIDARQFDDVVAVVAFDEQFALGAIRHCAVDAVQGRTQNRSYDHRS